MSEIYSVSYGVYVQFRRENVEWSREQSAYRHADVAVKIGDEVKEFELDDFMRRLGFAGQDVRYYEIQQNEVIGMALAEVVECLTDEQPDYEEALRNVLEILGGQQAEDLVNEDSLKNSLKAYETYCLPYRTTEPEARTTGSGFMSFSDWTGLSRENWLRYGILVNEIRNMQHANAGLQAAVDKLGAEKRELIRDLARSNYLNSEASTGAELVNKELAQEREYVAVLEGEKNQLLLAHGQLKALIVEMIGELRALTVGGYEKCVFCQWIDGHSDSCWVVRAKNALGVEQ